MIKTIKSLSLKVWGNPWIVLLYTASIWGCNAVAAKLAVNQISPMCLVFLRWVLVCSILGFFIKKSISLNLPVLFSSWKKLLWMGFAGFTGFSALFYLAAYKTTAVNITLLQSSMPPLVMLGAIVFFKEKVSIVRVVGMVLALIGMFVIATQGEIERLVQLNFNAGDSAIILACILYAAYTLSLRNRPLLPSIVFFFGMSISALISSLPLAVGEILTGHAYWPSLQGFYILLFVTLGPTLTAQLAYMRGVALIGPARASLFPSLVPAFGALFSIVILGENFEGYHLGALILGVGGIFIAESKLAKTTFLNSSITR